jgi:hypothetical protein
MRTYLISQLIYGLNFKHTKTGLEKNGTIRRLHVKQQERQVPRLMKLEAVLADYTHSLSGQWEKIITAIKTDRNIPTTSSCIVALELTDKQLFSLVDFTGFKHLHE